MFTLPLLLLFCWSDDKEIVAGPELNKPIPSLKTLQIVGDQADKEIDWKETAKTKPTLIVFVRCDKWDRPVARVLKQLDDALVAARNDLPDTHIAFVWISKDGERAREYLPKVQQSLKMQASSWNHFNGEVYDATGWQLSGDGALNIVLVKDNKAVWGRAYSTMQESIAKQVMMELKRK
ncbi:MAG: hypothetical protein QM703_22315 [Gemmatales bacterium]